MYKKLYLAGLGVYAVLFILAAVFSMERIVFSDGAFAIFHLVKDGDFGIQVYRFGDGLSKIFPLLAYYLHMPLHIIVLSYSLGFIMFYFGCYLVCGSRLRQYGLALIILLTNILFVTHSFYWPIPQEAQGIVLLAVLLAVLWGKDIATLNIGMKLVTIALLVTIAFFHPLMAIAIAYVIAYFALSGNEGIPKKTLWGIGISYVIIIAVKTLFFRTLYERQSLSGLKNFFRLFPNYFNTYANHHFLRSLATEYYWVPITTILILRHYLKQQKYKMACFFAAALIAYTGLINTTYPNSDSPAFYMEALYIPLALFIALPLILDVLPSIKKEYGMLLMVFIMATGCYRIYTTHSPFTKRLNWERAFLHQYGHRKMIVNTNKVDAATLQMTWGTPYEFWLLSTVENGYSASIIIDDTPSKRSWAAERTKEFIVNWNDFPYSTLNNRYFLFQDTTTGYEIEPELK